jgi:hypothetical protein
LPFKCKPAALQPGALSSVLYSSGSVRDETTAAALSQLVSPPLMQVRLTLFTTLPCLITCSSLRGE